MGDNAHRRKDLPIAKPKSAAINPPLAGAQRKVDSSSVALRA
jgi:hypothetical protein